MNYSGFIKTAFSVVVVVLVVVAVVIPTINDASGSPPEVIATNEGVPYAAPDGGEHTIVVSNLGGSSNPDIQITVDGEIVDLSSIPGTILNVRNGPFWPFIIADSGVVYQYSASVSAAGPNGYKNPSLPATITISGNTATIDNYTIPDVKYYISTNGDYVLTDSASVLQDTTIYGGTKAYVNADKSLWYTFAGSLGGAFGFGFSSTADATLDDLSFTQTPGDDDLIEISAPVLAATVPVSGSDVEITSSPIVFLVPVEIMSEGAASPYAFILGVLPVLMIVGVLLFTASMFAANRRV